MSLVRLPSGVWVDPLEVKTVAGTVSVFHDKPGCGRPDCTTCGGKKRVMVQAAGVTVTLSSGTVLVAEKLPDACTQGDVDAAVDRVAAVLLAKTRG